MNQFLIKTNAVHFKRKIEKLNSQQRRRMNSTLLCRCMTIKWRGNGNEMTRLWCKCFYLLVAYRYPHEMNMTFEFMHSTDAMLWNASEEWNKLILKLNFRQITVSVYLTTVNELIPCLDELLIYWIVLRHSEEKSISTAVS